MNTTIRLETETDHAFVDNLTREAIPEQTNISCYTRSGQALVLSRNSISWPNKTGKSWDT